MKSEIEIVDLSPISEAFRGGMAGAAFALSTISEATCHLEAGLSKMSPSDLA